MGFGDWLAEVGKDIYGGIRTVEKYTSLPIEGAPASPLEQLLGDKSANAGNVIQPKVNAGVEQLGQWTQWLRSTVVSHPLSTWSLMSAQAYSNPSRIFSTQEWARAWRAGAHVSPGQAISATSLFIPGIPAAIPAPGGSARAEKIVNSPVEYYTPSLADLPPEFAQLSKDEQQALLKEAGSPVVGNRYIEEMRQSSKAYRYASGAIDFGLAWYADPTIVAGKYAASLKAARVIKAAPVGGYTAADIDKLLANSRMSQMEKWLWENRDKPQVVANLDFAAKSAMGGERFANLVSRAESPDDINMLLRVGLGDINTLERLMARNEMMGQRLQQMNDRYDHLDLAAQRYAGQPLYYNAIRQQMDDLDKLINADELAVIRYNDIVNHAFELDKINLTRWSFARAEARAEAQNLYRAGAAYGYKASREARIQPGRPVVSRENWQARTPIEGGFIKQRVYGVGDLFSKPVTVVRAMHNANPNGWMRIDDLTRDNLAELRAQVARIPNITADTRSNLVNAYLKTTTEGERMALLDELETLGAAKIAEKHGMDPKAGQEIYQEWKKQQSIARTGVDPTAQEYSAAQVLSKFGNGVERVGDKIRVWEFEANGSRLVAHPHTVTRLKNSHVFLDLDEMDKLLARHSSALSALRTAKYGNPDWILDGMDFMTSFFKVSVLFRLGYIPRVLSDDLTGQWASAGSAAMAARAVMGVRNTSVNAYRALSGPWQAAKESAAHSGLQYAENEIKIINNNLRQVRAQLAAQAKSNQRVLAQAQKDFTRVEAHYQALSPTDQSARALGIRRQYQQKLSQLRQANNRVAVGPSPGKTAFVQRESNRLKLLEDWHALTSKKVDDLAKWREVKRQGSDPIVVDGIRFPAAFEGREGQLHLDLVSADSSIGNLFNSNRQMLNNNLVRSFDHGGRVIRASQGELEHSEAWAYAINNQIMQDPLEKLAVGRLLSDGTYVPGATTDEMITWLRRTPEGRQYRRRIGLKLATPEELARRAKAEVDEYMHLPEIRMKALEGEVTPAFLREAEPRMQGRPEVHTGVIGMQSQGGFRQGLDRLQQRWFNFAATIPANRMSRHPLYNQLYEGHVRQVTNQLKKQGGYTVSDVNMVTRAARRRALRDTRRLVFDIAHRSDAAAALRFMSPFFSATAEAFQRWGRIIADKPQIVGYAANFYNAPLALGNMQDADGNDIMRDGTVLVKGADGKFKKVTVPKKDRWIVGRMPGWLASSPVGIAFGVEHSSGNFALSQNSVNLVTQGDPWFNPGFGPVVQIPVNELVKDKPTEAEFARQLGILPFGPDTSQNPAVRVSSGLTSGTLRNLLTAWDTSDERYQGVKLQIMQRAAWEHDNLGKPMLTPEEINARTKDFWYFSALSSFTQPAATKRRDAYQFYRDEYNKLRRQDPVHADQNFLDRYGEDYFVFAQAQTRNVTGVQATKRAYELEKEWAPLIQEFPELGALIVGPEGNGPFSPEVYAYQLNHPLTPGGTEMERQRLSADDAMKENQRRLGWSKFMGYMNDLRAQLVAGGFQSFNDKGAEVLKATKRAVVMLYGDPLLPDGQENPYYNAEWSSDYYSYDVRKNDRMALALGKVVSNDRLVNDPRRQDLKLLKEYLTARNAVNQILLARKGAGGASTLGAKTNKDLADGWAVYVDGLVEQSTDFEDLYNRYLSRDLGIDATPEES